MGFEVPSFDPLATLAAPAAREPRASASAPDFGSGNVRFDQMLLASGLPLSDSKDFARIFSVLPARQKEDVIDRWEVILPKLLAATGAYEKECAAIAEKYVRTMFEKANELYLRHQETLAASRAQQEALREGTQAFESARADRSRSAQMDQIRAMAAGRPAPASSAPDDPLAALA